MLKIFSNIINRVWIPKTESVMITYILTKHVIYYNKMRTKKKRKTIIIHYPTLTNLNCLSKVGLSVHQKHK